MLILVFDGSLVTGVTVPLVERNVLLVAFLSSNEHLTMLQRNGVLFKRGGLLACNNHVHSWDLNTVEPLIKDPPRRGQPL